jgi:hypothetical protein
MAAPTPIATPGQKSFALAKVGVTATKVTVKQKIRDKTAAFFMVFSPFLFFILTKHQVKKLKKPILTIYLFFRLNQVKKRYDR